MGYVREDDKLAAVQYCVVSVVENCTKNVVVSEATWRTLPTLHVLYVKIYM